MSKTLNKGFLYFLSQKYNFDIHEEYRNFNKTPLKFSEGTVDKWITLCEAHFNMPLGSIKGKSRKHSNPPIVPVRHVLMTMCVEKGIGGLSAVGLIFGGRDHSTVIHAKQTVYDLLSVKDEIYTQVVKDIKFIIDREEDSQEHG